MRSRRNAILTFEWILLITLLVIGMVSGLAVIRDAFIIECGEVVDAMLHYDKSYYINSPTVGKIFTESGVGEEIIGVEGSFAGGSYYDDVTSKANTSHVEIRTQD